MLEPNITLQNRYQIIRMLAQGGMGAVYEAKDQRLGNIVALKETFFADEDLRRAFHREAGILATLRHPALPKVMDHFSEGDGQFLVMEFIKGDDLYQILKRNNGPISQREVLKWADQLLGTLEYLHSQQPPVIHRDIKPQNLKLNEKGEIVLLDFGLAKEDADVTMAAKSVFGYSLNYAPLEQIQSKGTDPRSDIYSVAATLYHLLTGTAPADAVNRATAVIEGRPDTLRPAAEVNPAVSLEVSSILEQALSLDRNRRPTNAYILRGQIQRAISAVERAITNAATQQHQGQQYQAQIPQQQAQYGGPRPTTPYATQQNPQGGGTYATMPPPQGDKIRFEIPLQSAQQGGGQFPPAGYDANATNAYSTAEPSKSKGGLIAGILIALLAVGGGAYWIFLRGDNVGTNASGEIVINGITPTKLVENIISDKGSQTDRYWQFTAHAGQITFTLDAVGSGSTVSLEALRNGKELLQFDGDKPSLTVTSNNRLDERIIGSLIMPRDETIVLRVKTSSPTSLIGYRVLIDGATSLTTRANDDPNKLCEARDKPTTPSFNALLLGSYSRKESYYTFNAGQGELSVDTSLLGNASLSVEIFSEKGGEPLKFTGDLPNVTVSSDGMIEQASGKVTIDAPQRLVMRIVNSSPKTTQAYKIKLGGAAQLKDRPTGMKMSENQAGLAKLLEGRENPTPMTSSEISGVIPGKESYFTFVGGPGSVNVTLELESSGAVSTIQFFDSQSKRLSLSNGSDTLKLTNSGRAEASFTVPSEERILMRVGVSAPGNVTNFTLKLDGNIKL